MSKKTYTEKDIEQGARFNPAGGMTVTITMDDRDRVEGSKIKIEGEHLLWGTKERWIEVNEFLTFLNNSNS